jgi:flagellar hook-basal body complex protein FliE
MASEIEFRLISPTEATQGRAASQAPGPTKAGEGFGAQLTQAISSLDGLQTEADGQANAIAKGGGNLHEVALAFEKADVAMRLATRVRNKLVDAYNEIMRMSV